MWAKQPVQAGECHLRFGWNACGREYAEPVFVGAEGGLVEQRCLADAGFPTHQERTAARPDLA